MKITLWQQFSSNHSASFTVVGKFPSAEAAQTAYTEIVHHLKQIKEWWEKLSTEEVDEWLAKVYDHKVITPVEAALAQRYGVDWEYSIDNIQLYLFPEGNIVNRFVQRYG